MQSQDIDKLTDPYYLREDIQNINRVLQVMNQFLRSNETIILKSWGILSDRNIEFIKSFAKWLYQHLGIDERRADALTQITPVLSWGQALARKPGHLKLLQLFSTYPSNNSDNDVLLACPSENVVIDFAQVFAYYTELPLKAVDIHFRVTIEECISFLKQYPMSSELVSPLKCNEFSPLRLLGRDVYRLIASKIEKEAGTKTLIAYSGACRLFRDITRVQRDQLKAKSAWIIKIVLISKPHTGLKSLRHRIVHNEFSQKPDTADVVSRIITMPGKAIRLDFMKESYFRYHQYKAGRLFGIADIMLLLVDLTSKDWFEDIRSALVRCENDLQPKIIIGTKSDLTQERVVDFDRIKDLTDSKECVYVETSALTGENLDELFERLNEIITNNFTFVKRPLKTDQNTGDGTQRCSLQ